MKVLVIGSGGREHALVWKISKSPQAQKIYCAPGNAGVGELAECVAIRADDIPGLLKFSEDQGVDLTVVGPELPLTLGIADEFQKNGLKVFGPTRDAARLEGSKAFAKAFMKRHGIPTAEFHVFSSLEDARTYLRTASFPQVIKADGLAAGKGVLVASNRDEALKFADEVMGKKVFGEAGRAILVEECLQGREISVLAFSDGKTFVPLPAARDYKRVWDHDEGPNTGGMGSFSPVPDAGLKLLEDIASRVFAPLIRGMAREGVNYQGVIYAGLMLTAEGPKVLEFNVRFGDPETQVIVPRIQSDLIGLFMACCEGTLDKMRLEVSDRAALCVVLASGGYPGPFKNGYEIRGLENFDRREDVLVFHAGTTSEGSRRVTRGGRVLGLTAMGKDLSAARNLAYQAVAKIHFEAMHYRRDIGR